MRILNLARIGGLQSLADVAMPQAAAFGQFPCQFGTLSAIVHAGRTQAAFTSHKGAAQSTPPANKWSRGCRALNSPYLHFAWSLLSPLAPSPSKKLSTLTSLRLSLSSRPTPANISKTEGRALWAGLAQPALFLSDAGASAKDDRVSCKPFAQGRGLAYGAGINLDADWRDPCVPQPSLLSSPLPPLPLAPRRKCLSSRHLSIFLSSRLKPASTSNLARRVFWPASVRANDASFAQEVASC